MTERLANGPTHTARIVMRVEPEFRDRTFRAAEVRDGGNISRFVRRAIDRLIAEEKLEESEAKSGKAA